MTTFRTIMGSLVPADQVVGRDDLITHIWDLLERQSLLLLAERRMGKTSIIKKMSAEVPQGKLVYYQDLEAVQTAGEFARSIFETTEDELSKSKKTAVRAQQFISQMGGAKVSGIEIPQIAQKHWKALLNHTLSDLLEHSGQQAIFMWDEFPWMIQNIKRNEGEGVAMELLDALRAMRNTHPKLRMVLTGSIGLHHVISTLKETGYNNAPVNDLYSCEVPPLSRDAAQQLASKLLEGERVTVDNESQVAVTIAKEVDGVAFYVHHVVDCLKSEYRGQVIGDDAVKEVVENALYDGQDRWQLRHYYSRLSDPTYYGTRAPLATIILDTVAGETNPVPLQNLLNRVQGQNAQASEDTIRNLLDLLGRDHYLLRTSRGYDFRFPLIKRWWRVYRGLDA